MGGLAVLVDEDASRAEDFSAKAKAVVLIPARNEAAMIGAVVRGCRRSGFAVVVIDDGSRDDTAHLARAAGAKVLTMPRPQHGKTAALRLGLRRLADAAEWIFFLDGDGQHRPADLERFWQAREEMDMVVGNRLPDAARMPLVRRWTNRAMSLLLGRSGVRDSQCGFRLVRRAWLGAWLPRGSHFQFETELALLAATRPTRVVNLSIAAIYDREQSKISPWRDTVNFAVCLFRHSRTAN
jgi:glycosyltransferase involved in cell wall biosynthesis